MRTTGTDLGLEVTPPLQDILDVIGQDSMQKIMSEYGGTRLHIPKELTETHKPARLLGVVTARTLSNYCGGDYLDIPLMSSQTRDFRNIEIVRRRNSGESFHDLVRAFNLSHRTITTIVSKAKG